jgi:hypothetical protein
MDLLCDDLLHAVLFHARKEPRLRLVCSSWRTWADTSLVLHYEDHVASLLDAMRIRVCDTASLRRRTLQYALSGGEEDADVPLPVEAMRGPRYTCGLCGKATHAILECRCREFEVFVRMDNDGDRWTRPHLVETSRILAF